LQNIVAHLEPSRLTAAELQQLRAVAVLERIGSDRAKELLSRLAKGGPAGRQTQEASASLRRLGSLQKLQAGGAKEKEVEKNGDTLPVAKRVARQ
jgi:hypothetical protein